MTIQKYKNIHPENRHTTTLSYFLILSITAGFKAVVDPNFNDQSVKNKQPIIN